MLYININNNNNNNNAPLLNVYMNVTKTSSLFNVNWAGLILGKAFVNSTHSNHIADFIPPSQVLFIKIYSEINEYEINKQIYNHAK